MSIKLPKHNCDDKRWGARKDRYLSDDGTINGAALVEFSARNSRSSPRSTRWSERSADLARR